MNNKTVLIMVFLILLVGIIVGGLYVYNTNKLASSQTGDVNTQSQAAQRTGATVVKIMPSPTIVQPTIPVLPYRIKNMDDNQITITGKSGDMGVPKNPAKYKVFKTTPAGLVEGTYDDLSVGQYIKYEVDMQTRSGKIIIP